MKILTPLLLIAISIGLFFVYINPAYSEIGALRDQNKSLTAALDRAQQAGIKRDQLLSKRNQFSTEDLNRLQKILPDSIDNIRLVVDINSIAVKYGTSIKAVKVEPVVNTPGSPAPATPYDGATITFDIVLTYDNFLSFLADIERNLRLTDVVAVSFDTGDKSVYQYNVTLKTYRLK